MGVDVGVPFDDGDAVPEGDVVDEPVGELDGDGDDDVDVVPLGLALGEAEGEVLGDVVGDAVGLADGESVGIDDGVSKCDTGVPSSAPFMNAAQMRVGNEPPVTEFMPPTPDSVMGLPLASSFTNITAAARSGV